MADVAAHPDTLLLQPLIAEALIESASPQLRNMALIGGNLMQRVRCPYFRMLDAPATSAIRVRAAPRSTASTERRDFRDERPLRRDASFGPRCLACRARGHTASAGPAAGALIPSRGALPAAGQHASPRTHAASRRTDRRGARAGGPHARRARYLKVRDRSSYEFALVSAAAALDIERGVSAGPPRRRRRRHYSVAIARVRRCAGRERAGSSGLGGGRPASHRRGPAALRQCYKVELLLQTIVRALEMAEEIA